MFSHLMLGVNDLWRSKAFYGAVLGTIGLHCIARPKRLNS